MKECPPPPTSPQTLVIVTGLSGAGKTQALKILRDIGYEVVDNLPLPFVTRFLTDDGSSPAGPCAVGLDVSTRGFSSENLTSLLEELRLWPHLNLHLLYLTCHDDVLSRRFIETRYKHPLAHDRPVKEGLALERNLLAPLRERADTILDTSDYSISQLKKAITDRFTRRLTRNMVISLMSFSFKKGIPQESDLVFDVRFLRNPHWDYRLRDLTGQSLEVQQFIQEDKRYEAFFNHLLGMIDFLIPPYEEEGKSYLTISVGCTGGKHRSVCVIEDLAHQISNRGYQVTVTHQGL